MIAAVRLPDGEDENEWLAVHVVDFYNEVSLLYGAGACGKRAGADGNVGGLLGARLFSLFLRQTPELEPTMTYISSV